MYFCTFSECNYKTLWPANLRRHAAVHEKASTGGNGCSLCLYRTARHNNVVRHLRLVHGGKGFVVKPSKKSKAKQKSAQGSYCEQEQKQENEPMLEQDNMPPLEQKDEPLLEQEDEPLLEQEEEPPLDQEIEFLSVLDEELEYEQLSEFDEEPEFLRFEPDTELDHEEEQSFCHVYPYSPKSTAPDDDIIIWPESRHQEATFYNPRKSASVVYICHEQRKSGLQKS